MWCDWLLRVAACHSITFVTTGGHSSFSARPQMILPLFCGHPDKRLTIVIRGEEDDQEGSGGGEGAQHAAAPSAPWPCAMRTNPTPTPCPPDTRRLSLELAGQTAPKVPSVHRGTSGRHSLQTCRLQSGRRWNGPHGSTARAGVMDLSGASAFCGSEPLIRNDTQAQHPLTSVSRIGQKASPSRYAPKLTKPSTSSRTGTRTGPTTARNIR